MTHILPRWLPALLMMLIIFLFSSQPSSDLPDFNWADKIVKKGGHLLGYAILALSYWYAFRMQKDKRGLAWLLAVLYALTDEFHQAFVPGRHSTIWDVLIFDNFGAMLSLWIVSNRINNT
jgi:VanZ family protein